jgi:methylenetetrahydrofolate dehydrogenase (NADP+)/methenyltetrahydrofolate cyclohydrolase
VLVTARIIDGKAVAAALRARLAERVAALPFRPGLAVVLVGDNPASAVYVRNKDRAATSAGIGSRTIVLPADTAETALLDEIARLNADPDVDGILVQLPLPPQIRPQVVIEAIDPAKDVDGFHPLNVGRLADNQPALVPCTPLGVMKLLESAGVAVGGARAVVLGRSAIVGKPMAALLLAANATVTIAHSRTRDLAGECRRAEILVAAVGRPELVRGDWISDGATVIDVGINRLPDGRLVGDVAFAEAVSRAGAITPVPGGVGPMTIACLLENTVSAALTRRVSGG